MDDETLLALREMIKYIRNTTKDGDLLHDANMVEKYLDGE